MSDSPANPATTSPYPNEANAFFMEMLQVRIQKLEGGECELTLDVQERHLRSLGILHGGVLASLLDSAMGMAVHTTASPDHYTVTVQLNVNFIRPAWPKETLIASGKVRHSGRQTAVAFGEVRTAEGQLVGTGTGTFLYLAHSEKTREAIRKVPDDLLPKD